MFKQKFLNFTWKSKPERNVERNKQKEKKSSNSKIRLNDRMSVFSNIRAGGNKCSNFEFLSSLLVCSILHQKIKFLLSISNKSVELKGIFLLFFFSTIAYRRSYTSYAPYGHFFWLEILYSTYFGHSFH